MLPCQVKEANNELDKKIAGIREHNACVARDLETCLEDVTADKDPTCIVWRDRVLKCIFQAGLLDIGIVKNVSFSNKSKYKYPTEQYQIIQALKPELGMLQAGISDLKDRISNLKSEISGISSKNKTVDKQRAVKQEEFKKTENLVSRTNTKLARLDLLLNTTTKATEEQLERLVEILPHTNMLETMEAARKEDLLGGVLERLKVAGKGEDEITQYNRMKEEILGQPGKYPTEVEYEFLVKDWRYQLEVEERLLHQLHQLREIEEAL